MDSLTSSSIVTALLGLVLLIWGYIFGRRTGKLFGYAVLLIGIGLIALGVMSFRAKRELDHKLAVEHFAP